MSWVVYDKCHGVDVGAGYSARDAMNSALLALARLFREKEAARPSWRARGLIDRQGISSARQLIELCLVALLPGRVVGDPFDQELQFRLVQLAIVLSVLHLDDSAPAWVAG